MSNYPPTVPGTRLKAILLAVLVTLLWSSSWVLIKTGLQDDLPALTFAGLRYSLAFVCLLPFVLGKAVHRRTLRTLPRAGWLQLIVLGVIYYAVTQGAQFVGLVFLPAATLTLVLNFSPVIIALLSGFLTREPTSLWQWGGILLSTCGALIYFLPLDLPAQQVTGLAVGLVGLLANAASSLLGRQVNARSGLPPVVVTTVSMGVGAALLLASGVISQGFGELDLRQWLIVAWLAVVNTAIAFTLWNYCLKTLTAVESAVINNLMLPQIALLAWLFLDEALTPRQIGGLLVAAAGTLVVQLWRRLPGANQAAAREVEAE